MPFRHYGMALHPFTSPLFVLIDGHIHERERHQPRQTTALLPPDGERTKTKRSLPVFSSAITK